jgi:hypothetical protein
MILKLDEHIIVDDAIQDGSKFLGWYPESLADGGVSLTKISEPEFANSEFTIHSVILTREDLYKLKELGLI